jgi:hypothetical protein
MCDINDIKKSLKREEKDIQLQRQIKLINELGEPAHKFRIIDSIQMTPELIEEFKLAIKTGVPGRKPKGREYTNRPTIGDKYEIRWRYDLREGISGPKKLPDGRTRPFCTELIDANRFYSKEDINTMSNGFSNLPVFDYAGGYYSNPETGETTPFCRHSFYMIFVEKK